ELGQQSWRHGYTPRGGRLYAWTCFLPSVIDPPGPARWCRCTADSRTLILVLLLAQFRQPLLRFGDVLRIGLVGGNLAVEFDGARPFLQILVVEMGRPQAGVE